MTIDQPLSGEILDFALPVRFEGTCGAETVQVTLLADGKYPLPDATVANGKWALTCQFSGPGQRQIAAADFDASGTQTGSANVTITLRVSQLNGYQPPTATLAHLGTIAHELEISTRVVNSFTKGGSNVFLLPGGSLYFDSPLDLDDDGSVYAAQDPDGQNDTSLHDPDGSAVDAYSVPYFVLPGGFYKKLGISLGDVAAVLFGGRIEYAVFADVGPGKKLGEGSIALHQALGHQVVKNGKLIDSAIDSDVVTIVFPGSGDGTPQNPDEIRLIGAKLLASLGGVP